LANVDRADSKRRDEPVLLFAARIARETKMEGVAGLLLGVLAAGDDPSGERLGRFDIDRVVQGDKGWSGGVRARPAHRADLALGASKVAIEG